MMVSTPYVYIQLGSLSIDIEQNLTSHTFDFEAVDITPAGKVRIIGKIDFEEIAKWRSDLREIFKNVRGTCGFKMGADSHLVIVIDTKKNRFDVSSRELLGEQFHLATNAGFGTRPNISTTFFRATGANRSLAEFPQTLRLASTK